MSTRLRSPGLLGSLLPRSVTRLDGARGRSQGDAQRKKQLIDTSRHTVIEPSHYSPQSARKPSLDGEPFSPATRALLTTGRLAIDWGLAYQSHDSQDSLPRLGKESCPYTGVSH